MAETQENKKVLEVETLDEYYNIFEEHKKDTNRFIVYFYASWCGPCKKFSPKYEEYATNNPDIVFIKINIENEEFDDLVNKNEIKKIPTFYMMDKNNELICYQTGRSGFDEFFKH